MGSNEKSYTLVHDSATFARALNRLSGCKSLALDMEMENNFHRYGLHIALIQMSAPDGTDYIFDPLSGVDIKALGGILGSPDIELVVHDAEFDRYASFHAFRWRLANVFDTKIAAQLCGIRKFGLASLLESLLGVKTNKRFQKIDWMKRPLREEALEYAHVETHYLFDLKKNLESKLLALDRMEWAREEFAFFDSRHQADAAAAPRRIKGVSKLPPRQQAIAKAIAEFREKMAKELDVPPHYVINGETVLALALSPPCSAGELAAARRMHPAVYSEKRLHELFAAIRKASEVPIAPPLKKFQEPASIPDKDSKQRLAAMQVWRKNLAHKLDLEPHLLLPNDVLKWYARHGKKMEMPESVRLKIRKWQRKLFWDDFERTFG